LNAGDTIGVVAPGFAVPGDQLKRGLAALRAMGFEPRVGAHVTARHGYLAGDDEARSADLCQMLNDPDVRAVWFARGGFGTARLLDRLPWSKLERRPKPLIGYSDVTALFAPYVERTGQPCLYGPVVTELGRREAFHAPSLRRLLAGESLALGFPPSGVLVPGRASGRLAGGNLSVLSHLLGTPFAPRFRGAILLLEETGEETYRIDRMLTQLGQSGALDGVAAVVLGAMVVPARRRFPPDRRLHDVLRDHLAPLGVPVVRGLPVGHRPGKWTLPLGAMARLDTEARRLEFPR